MDQKQAIAILVIIKAVILGLIVVGSCIYAIPLCLIRRFHTSLHMLTLNVCITAFMCSGFWGIYFIMSTFYMDILWTVESCLPILYLQNMVVCQVLYAICTVSLNRLLVIVYHNRPLFRTKRWTLICIILQWIFAAVLPLPTFGSSLSHCFVSGLELNFQIYALVIIAIIPAICLAVTSIIIFVYVRRSSRRVQPMHEQGIRISVLNHRDDRILKHMLFMFAVFFCGWVPIYIIGAVNWNGTAISYVLFHGLTILPAVSLFTVIVDLFLYNHELRGYLMNRQQTQPTSSTRPDL